MDDDAETRDTPAERPLSIQDRASGTPDSPTGGGSPGPVTTSAVGGFVLPGYEGVREAFAAAAERPGGAAFAAYKDGRLVVDLWLGEAEPGRPWERDTPAITMSSIKGVTAMVAHVCAERGLLDLDAPVSEYWPEFAANGKHRVLVRHVLSHTSGVTTVPGYLDFMQPDGTGWDFEEITRRIATATPRWEPGTKSTYHALTFGWMMDAIILRATGMSVQEVLHAQINQRLGVDIRLGGAPGEAHVRNRARVISPPRPADPSPEQRAFEREFTSAESPLGQTVLATGTSNLILELERFVNDGPGFTLPLSGSNGIATARDVARIYQLLALGGELDGVRLLSERAVERAAAVVFEGTDEFWGTPARWASGFHLSGNLGARFGLDDSGFGHPGQGGQYGWADPQHGLAFAYLRSYLGLEFDTSPMDALYEALR